MKMKPHRLITDTAPLTLLDVVGAVSSLSADESETAQVINHMLLTRRIRFLEALDQEEFARLHS